MNATWDLPLLPSADVVIVGASTAAVAAALELRALGREVLVVCDLPFFGEELAGALVLEPELEGSGTADPLLAALAAERREGRLFPGAAKRVADEALIREGARFLFMTRPVALLRAEDGRPAGLVLAHRTSLFAVRAGGVLDASAGGLVARLAGAPLRALRAPAGRVEWRVVATEAPAGARALGETFEVRGEKQAVRVGLHALSLARPEGDERARLHRLRAAVADPAVRRFADVLNDPGSEVVSRDGRLAANEDALGDEAFCVEAGLWMAGGVLPLEADAARGLAATWRQCALGRRVARLLAREPGVPVGAPLAGGGGSGAGVAGGDAGGLGFVSAFLRGEPGRLVLDAPRFADWGGWDVVVAGGGTGGAPAGISAAREGARTLVIEAQPCLGGVGTAGLIASYWFGNRVGFTAELDALVRGLDPTRKQHSRWNPELKAAAYHRLLAEAGGEAWMHSFVFGVRQREGRVDGLLVSTPFGCGLLGAGAVIDATGGADVAAAAGAPCRVIGREHAAVQGTGLSPRSPGRDYCNSDHCFVDDNDPEGLTHAHVRARAKFREEFDVASFLDSRERRQIVGDIELSPLDFLAGRTFPDTVCTAHSNFDSHGFTVHPVFMMAPPDKRPMDAHVPLRCMLPRGLDGVIVTGLGMSAHRDALPVIRMQADVQNQGFAAGLVAAESARAGRAVRAVDLRAVQRRLVAMGALAPEVPGQGDSFPLPAGRVDEALAAGPGDYRAAAVLFAHADEARPRLRERLGDAVAGDEAAIALGLMGDEAAGPRLLELVRNTPWDEGWNFRGMHQFGASLSRLDAAIIALGRTRHPGAAAVLAGKIRELGADAAFSHARAAGVAAACLRDPVLAQPLRALLARPGVGGHARTRMTDALERATSLLEEDAPRSLALRELYLAKGLLACGDVEGAGRRTLEIYARDLRGVLARHAREVLRDSAAGEVLELA